MAVDRLLPTEEAAELVALVREIAQAELAPRAAADEAAADLAMRCSCWARWAAGPAVPRGIRRCRTAVRGLPAGPRGSRQRG